MRTVKNPSSVLLAALVIAAALFSGVVRTAPAADDIATIRPERQTGFANAGWNLDRYKDLEPLKAGRRITVADLKGPGVIQHIHTTRHGPKEIMARGIVIEIWFDDAKEPAVRCPLADFFGDGCNGNGENFTSNCIECAPWSYNCYIPMPFAKRAKVIFANETDTNTTCYAYVEWEKIPKWDPAMGYFHATYRRKCFQLTKDTDELFFDVEGTGHVLGRQFSVVTDEPNFKHFRFVMEGNNEVNIDGEARRVDYLGSEDSFTFSWGFQRTFAGLHAGMTLVDIGTPNRLSIYRFHDHMPIRFNRRLQWRINWSQEVHCTRDPRWLDATAKGGGWVDYATVFYWYLNNPGGFKHEALPPCAERRKVMLHTSPTAEVKK
jgi:hypothetical protein